MKPYFLTPIVSLDQAHAFLRQLDEDGLLFHPEDHPSSIVSLSGAPLFSDEESAVLEDRVREVYQFDPDPCEFCLTLGGNQCEF